MCSLYGENRKAEKWWGWWNKKKGSLFPSWKLSNSVYKGLLMVIFYLIQNTSGAKGPLSAKKPRIRENQIFTSRTFPRLRKGLLKTPVILPEKHRLRANVRICAYMWIYIYMNLYVNLYVNLYMNLYLNLNVNLYVNLHMNLYVNLYVDLYMNLYVNICESIYESIWLYVNLYINLYESICESIYKSIWIYMWIYMNLYMDIYIYESYDWDEHPNIPAILMWTESDFMAFDPQKNARVPRDWWPLLPGLRI